MFLLTLALRVFTLIEFVIRLALETSGEKLAGLYDGNPKRGTARPSAEQLLKAFDNLTLYLLPDTSTFVTTLSALHRQILSMLKLPESIYHLHLKHRKA
jgi:transposase